MRFFIGLTWLLSSIIALAQADFTPEIHSQISDHVSDTLLYMDDSSVILDLNRDQLQRSDDDGKNWNKVLDGVKIQNIYVDKVKKDRVFAFTPEKTHYVSNDQGANWNTFTVDINPNLNYEVKVNSKNPDKVLLAFIECDKDLRCKNTLFYTTDGFKTDPKLMSDKVAYCTFTKSNNVFDEGHDDRILCLETERDNHGYIRQTKIVTSTDFFQTQEIINDKSGALGSSFVLAIDVIQSYVVATVQTDKYGGTGSTVSLYVSKDGYEFKKAVIDASVVSDSFTFLPSTPQSLHISVWGITEDGKQISDILSSDSEGIQFKKLLENVESNFLGFVNLEKVETVDGVWIANVVEGYDSVTLEPLSKSKITFDDGRTWSYLKTPDCKGDDQCSLNLLSLEERRGDGQGATGATPGILMAIGSEGKTLDKSVLNMHTYASRDGGLNWVKTIDDPTIFAFGDLGNVIVAAPYVKSDRRQETLLTKTIYYSLDQAQTWQKFELDLEIFPFLLTTTIDGTTTKFILSGLFRKDNSNSNSQVIYSLDFAKAFDKTCEKGDFETWYGRSNEQGEGICNFGHRDAFQRRKQDAKCFVNKPFVDLKEVDEPCSCTELDFECNFGFNKNSKGECVANYNAINKICAESDSKDIKLQSKRKIPGNPCTGGDISTNEQTFNCDDATLKANKIEIVETSFKGRISRYVFLEQTPDHSSDETVIVKTTLNEVFISHDGGKNFKKYQTSDEIFEIYLNPYYKDDIFLIGSNEKLHISSDRGTSFQVVSLPSQINIFGLQILSFSNQTNDAFIYYGDEHCDSRFNQDCVPVAFLTTDRGRSWKTLAKNIRHCDFVGARYIESGADKNTIYCQINSLDGGALISSNDEFKSQDTLFEKIVGFATTTHYTVVAAIEGDSLKAYVTIDGQNFAAAEFPKDFQVHRQQAYTILGSESGAIFLHVTSNSRAGTEYGLILKSNSNGTSYVLSEPFVNRNEIGFVDYERVEGLEGIAIINRVENPFEAQKGSLKQLRTKITFNDGSDWDYIQPPSTDSEGKKYPCIGKPLEQCSLHLHGYTERKDFRDTFASGSATGVLIGVGNVGDKLSSFNDASTFLTADGGSTWREVKQGVYQWEYGDRGSIIVLVDDQTNTNTIFYSLDEGNSWNEYKFTEDQVIIQDIVTVPSDTSKRFLLIANSPSNKGEETKTYALDFENVFARQCVLDLDNPDKDDFEYWSPKHPFSSSACLFGHEAQYLRKLSDRTDCFIGSAPLSDAFKVIRDCPCTRLDYECDFNYAKAKDGTCKLIDGLEPEDHSEICKVDKDAYEYFEPTGYRKIPLSTCVGGQEFDKFDPIPCPGKEDEFNKKTGRGLHGFNLAIVIIVPILVFLFAVWFVYEKGIRRNGGFQRFGEIRLGEDDDLIENDATDKVVNTIVRGGITIIAAGIATFKMIKIFDGFLINKVKSIFSRGSRYSRRGAGYSSVNDGDFRDDDEEDILGDVIDDGEEDYNIDDGDDGEILNDESSIATEAADDDLGLDEPEGDEYTDDRNLE
ncbi:putative membrane protein [Wickerhamomyces ciferrii]|uniref:Membrane protein n=1 Tax=Wickerhamomyces ciferrii (strain ATCC 14091 / BCRC 22168 / CBS 111 / JCM 3599 / NBRC 0793 / NRRL Y-1031 F-60-10) TaxID=1206466 RepID=K0KJJ3_WICCF|nr:uncharacterized protein BN7_2693 [Wickerhamomyces ciferrii]CCH43146.1 putative membrane protein [Wickerhamomyces ciferrii]